VSAPPVNVDFVGRRARVTAVGSVLLLLGVAAASAAAFEYRLLEARRAGLELKLAAASRRTHQDPGEAARSAGLSAEAGRVAAELGTPWTRLLAEFEAASRDTAGTVAVLSIEPDHAKHSVRVSGESRDLPLTLAYVQRLQRSTLLRYAMLESHEVRNDDPQRPVRFALTAQWQEAP
jgi:hypothetical protein